VSSTQSKSAQPELPQLQFSKKTLLYVIIIAAVVVLLQVRSLGDWWNLIFFEPMLNSLLFLYRFLGRSWALSIFFFTIIIKVITLPVSLKQIRTTKMTQEMQPKLEAIKTKYKGNTERINQETMKLYKEAGINPTGCIGPMLIQFPIWIGLYQSVLRILANNPMQLLGLGEHIYPFFPQLSKLVPFRSHFMWLDLAVPDPYYILPILVVVLMWAQQKMLASPTSDSQQQQMNQSMQLMMPLMFGLFMFSTPAGVAFYFVVSNVLSIIQQYFTTGWGGLLPRQAKVSSTSMALKSPGTKGKADGRKRKKKR